MSNDIQIKLTAEDGITKVFQGIARSADQVGDDIEQAGKQGAKGMNELGKSAEDNARRVERLKAEATAIGAVMGTLGAGVIRAGDAYRHQRLELEALNRMYGDAAEQVIGFTEAMQDSTTFTNDAARQSAQIFATLTQNYGMSLAEVEQLLTRSADLSTLFGKSLQDTSQMIQNAMRGEAEYIEQVNISLQDNYVASQYAARGLGNWNTVTDDSAKAAFRFQLFMEQSEYAVGAAAAEAERAGGQFRQFLNELQDGGQAVGQFLGPIGEVAAELAPIAIALPVVSAGAGRLASTLRGSTIAMGALGVATSPVTLGIGALVAIGAVAVDNFMDQKRAAEEYAASLRTLDDTQEMLRRRGDEEIANLSQQAEDRVLATRELLTARSDFETYLAEKEAELGRKIYVGDPEYDMYLTAWDQSMQKIGASAEETTAVLARFNEAIGDPNVDVDAYLNWAIGLLDAAALTESALDDAAAVQTILNTELSEFSRHADTATTSTADFGAELERLRSLAGGSTSDVDELTASVSRIDAALQDGSLSVADLEAYLADLDRQMATGAISWALYQERVENVDEALLGLGESIGATGAALGEGVFDAAAAGLDATTEAAEENAAAIEAAEEAWSSFGTAIGAGVRGALDQTAGDIADLRQFISDTTTAMLELTGDADITSQLNLTGAATDASILAEKLTDAAGALENLQRIVIGNTDAIGGQVQGLEDWALELINVRGTWGEIDDLLNEGRISLDKYNEAQVAQEQISAANATVQRDLLAIQAAQAPILAQGAESTAAYVQSLREMNDGFNDTATGAQDQLAALALMDQGYQSQLLQVMEMADALDDLGAGGEAAFTSMIDSMVALDPAMAAVLEQVGLIDNVIRDQDGRILSYDVQIDGADGAMSEIERLTLSIDALTVAMGGVPPSVDVEVNADVSQADATVRDWATHGYTGGYTPTIPVDADTGPAAASLEAFEPPVINVPVALTMSLGGGLHDAAGDVLSALSVPELVVPAPDTSEANAAIDGVRANLASLDGNTAMTYVNVLDTASATILDVGGLLAGLDAASATVNIYANADSAYAAISDMQAYNGTVLATSYVDIVTRRSEVSAPGKRMGGLVDEYAMGGVTIRAGEAGPEIAHFPTGGMAMLPYDGLYTVPVNTYISPNNAVSGVGGDVNVTVHVAGSVITERDLTLSVAEAIAPALGHAISQRRASFGGLS